MLFAGCTCPLSCEGAPSPLVCYHLLSLLLPLVLPLLLRRLEFALFRSLLLHAPPLPSHHPFPLPFFPPHVGPRAPAAPPLLTACCPLPHSTARTPWTPAGHGCIGILPCNARRATRVALGGLMWWLNAVRSLYVPPLLRRRAQPASPCLLVPFLFCCCCIVGAAWC